MAAATMPSCETLAGTLPLALVTVQRTDNSTLKLSLINFWMASIWSGLSNFETNTSLARPRTSVLPWTSIILTEFNNADKFACDLGRDAARCFHDLIISLELMTGASASL